jgi:AraC family transcriptional regulator
METIAMTVRATLSPPEYGTLLRMKRISELLLWETAYPPHLTIPRHTHENGYFDLLLQGSYSETTTKERNQFGPSTLVYHPPGVEHADQILRDGLRIFKIKFSPCWLSGLREQTNILESSAAFEGGPAVHLAVTLYKEFRDADAFSPLAMEGLALEIVAAASRHAGAAAPRRLPRWLKEVHDLLHENFVENLTVSGIAGVVGVHPVHLSRVFRTYFRCTIGEYLRKLRVESAGAELAASDTPLAEIAAAVGFSDQSHFCRSFKRIMGLSPARYRATFRRR